MTASLFVNEMQVDFASVVAMENTEMARMFKTLEETWIKGKLALTKDVFAQTFGLPIERMASFLYIPNQTAVEMRGRFSGSDVPFREPNKKKEMKIEYSEKFDLMVAITAGLKVNWAQVLFQVLTAMVNNPTRQSQGFAVQLSVLLERLVKADLGESVKLHPQKVLTNKSVHTYIKKNMGVVPAGETSKVSGATASEQQSNADGPQALPKEPEKAGVEKPKKKKEKRHESAQQAQQSQTYTGKSFYPPIEIREINWVTYFLPKIDPADKGKGVLPYLDRPNLVEEHYLLVIQDIRDRAECQLQIYDQWHKFRTGYRLSKIPSMKLVDVIIQSKLQCSAEEVEKIIVSLDSKLLSMDSKIASDLDFIKLQLPELVNHLKELVMPKRGKDQAADREKDRAIKERDEQAEVKRDDGFEPSQAPHSLNRQRFRPRVKPFKSSGSSSSGSDSSSGVSSRAVIYGQWVAGIRVRSVMECKVLAISMCKLDTLRRRVLPWEIALIYSSRVLLDILHGDRLPLLNPNDQFLVRVPRLETPLQAQSFYTSLESSRGRTEEIKEKLRDLSVVIFRPHELRFRYHSILEPLLLFCRELLALSYWPRPEWSSECVLLPAMSLVEVLGKICSRYESKLIFTALR
ncbi:uridine-cytidine kinase C-like [Dorcoceras hygrometricum]|uniref:Uridine-cytidine kinase C-like n=1 Tax=Dorcoceras hygrometricum TaxID=472368 RepID=A0A2Z7DDV1_9LAMI|nr:uridine-cytidine kinase C-like [Dorcoceras hygrometricum]